MTTAHRTMGPSDENFLQKVLEVVESRGLAVHKDDDPVIIRVIARK